MIQWCRNVFIGKKWFIARIGLRLVEYQYSVFIYENECYMRVMFVEGYIILMKGVVGVLGDMYQIWISLVIMNVNNLQVMYFINIFKGYYKIDLL